MRIDDKHDSHTVSTMHLVLPSDPFLSRWLTELTVCAWWWRVAGSGRVGAGARGAKEWSAQTHIRKAQRKRATRILSLPLLTSPRPLDLSPPVLSPTSRRPRLSLLPGLGLWRRPTGQRCVRHPAAPPPPHRQRHQQAEKRGKTRPWKDTRPGTAPVAWSGSTVAERISNGRAGTHEGVCWMAVHPVALHGDEISTSRFLLTCHFLSLSHPW